MFDLFTERARQAVVLAQEEARTLKHNYIGTEHLLLGLLREEGGVAARVLESLDITVERFRAQVVRIVGSGEEITSGQIPFTPRAKQVLELAPGEAQELGHDYVGTEHILLGLARHNDGVAIRIMLDFDADAQKIIDEVVRMLCAPELRRRPVRTPKHFQDFGKHLDGQFAAHGLEIEDQNRGLATLTEMVIALQKRVEHLEARLLDRSQPE